MNDMPVFLSLMLSVRGSLSLQIGIRTELERNQDL